MVKWRGRIKLGLIFIVILSTFLTVRRILRTSADFFTTGGDRSGGGNKWPKLIVHTSDHHRFVSLKLGADTSGFEIVGDDKNNSIPNKPRNDNDKVSCRIPELLLDDPKLRSFFHHVVPLKCKSEAGWTEVAADGAFHIRQAAIDRHGGSINCDYVHFWRESDHRTVTKHYKDFQSGDIVKGDFYRVECKGKDGKKYENIDMTIRPDEKAIKRAGETKAQPGSLGINVVILGLDSVSRMTFIRKLPLTYKLLSDELEAVVLKGYNIVGDGTPQAFIPILTAQTEEELPLTRKRFKNANYVNVYPMIWKDFERAGYVTQYGEDSASIGTFTYRLKGFNEQPTDHYSRTFYSVAEKVYSKHPKNCFWDQPQHRIFWKYNREFLTHYPAHIPKFSLMHYSYLSHDDINTVELVDQDFHDHIRYLQTNGVLNNTLLIVMADHGHRFAKLRETHQGQLEERLPFMSWREPKDESAVGSGKLNRSLSLWDAVPKSRTCAQAGVEPHWCTCLSWKDLSVNDENVDIVSKALVQAINQHTKKNRNLCSELSLQRVESAKYLVPHDSLLKYKSAKDADGFVPDLTGNAHLDHALYQIRIRTTPGDGLYEATVKYDMRLEGKVIVDLDVVSHINKFGDKPHCIIDKDYFQAKYCVCYDKI